MSLVKAWILLLLALAWPAMAQVDAKARQAQAIQQLDDFNARVRRDGPAGIDERALAGLDRLFEQNNAELAARGDEASLAQGLIKRGSVARISGRGEAAGQFYQQARQHAQRAGALALQADAMGWQALAHFNASRLQQALALTTEALPIADRAGDADVLARVLDQHVAVLLKVGNFDAAAIAADRELAAAAQAKDPMAAYYARSSRADVALKHAEQCDHRPVYEICLRAIDDSRQDMLVARGIVAKLGYRYFEAFADKNIADLEHRRSLIHARAEEGARLRGLARFNPRVPGDVVVSELFHARGAVSTAPQQRQAYEEIARLRVEAARFRTDRPDAGWLFVQGQLADAEGRLDEALALYLQSIDALENDRRALSDERGREGFMGDRMSVYDAALMLLLQARRHAEAYALMERTRSRVLDELLAGRRPELRGAKERALITETGSLRARIAETQSRWVDADSRERADALAQRIQQDETRYRELMARIDRESPRLARLVSEQPATLAALQASMRAEGYEVLQYQVTDAALIVWHISADAVTVRNVFLPRAELAAKLTALRSSLATHDKPFDTLIAGELYLYLVQPFVSQMRSQRLVILPHGELGSLPFAVLRNPQTGRFFGDDKQLAYSPSASVLLRLKPAQALGNARIVAFADPGLNGGGGELQTLRQLFGTRAKVGTSVLPAKAELVNALAGQDVVHLALHGHFDAIEPMRSYLLLDRDAGDAGRLTAAEMFGLPLESARLVVLSACESGRADSTHANESLGMARGLLYAGAQSLLLSQWPVDSAATSDWMQAFYEAAKARPLAEAVQAASLRVKATPGHEHPFYWAAFTLISR